MSTTLDHNNIQLDVRSIETEPKYAGYSENQKSSQPEDNQQKTSKCQVLLGCFLLSIIFMAISGLAFGLIFVTINANNEDLTGKENITEEIGQKLDAVVRENDRLREELSQLSENVNELTNITDKIQHGPENCPEGWTPWRNTCYYVSKVMGTFLAAEKDCFDKGARLAFPRSVDEFVLLKSLIPGNSRTDAQGLWVDIKSDYNPFINRRRWINGNNEDVSTQIQSYWHYDQPGRDTSQQCVTFYKRENSNDMSFALHDISCDTEFQTWVCFVDV